MTVSFWIFLAGSACGVCFEVGVRVERKRWLDLQKGISKWYPKDRT